MNEATINRLVNTDPNTITAPALQAAIKELQLRKQKEQTENAIHQLDVVSRNTTSAVNTLRTIRKQESVAKKYLVALANAEDQFKKDGDFAAYNRAVADASRVNYSASR